MAVKCVALLLLCVPAHGLLAGPPLAMRARMAAVPNRSPSVLAAERVPQRGQIRRALESVRNAVFIGAASLLVSAPRSPQAMAGTTAPPPVPTPTKQASAGQTALTTIAMGGGLVYWSVRSAKEEDDEEQQRIKDETERLESQAKEYTDIDEGVISDEDMFAALRTRLNSTETGGDGEGDGPTGSADDTPPPTPPPAPAGGGGSALLEKPDTPDEPQPGASDADIERLKRMFGSSPDSA